MPEDKPSMMEILSDNGYRTHGIGKMHFTPDMNAMRGFQSRERQEEISSIDDNDYWMHIIKKGYDYVFDPFGQRSEMYYIPQISQMPPEDHPTNWVGDRALDFIKSHDYKKPFFLMVSFIHPHPPFSPPVPWNKIYRCIDMPDPNIPEEYGDCLTYYNYVQNRYKYRDQGIDRNLARTMKAFYYACISFVDYQIGRILKLLEDMKQIDKTLIIFASDHGEMLGDYNSFGKRSMLDSSARIPLIVRFPDRVLSHIKCNKPVSLVDIMPTVLDINGISHSSIHTDGESLHDIISGISDRSVAYSQYGEGQKALYMAVTETFKYIFSAPDDKEYFFDKKIDPLEKINIASRNAGHPEMKNLRKILIDYLRHEKQDAAVDSMGWRRYPILKVPDDPDRWLLFQDNIAVRDRETRLPEEYTANFPVSQLEV